MELVKAILAADAAGKRSVESPVIPGVSVDVIRFSRKSDTLFVDGAFTACHGVPLRLSGRGINIIDIAKDDWTPSDL